MLLMDNFRSGSAFSADMKLGLEQKDESLAGLNLEQVLDAHHLWKDRLKGVLNGSSDERLEIKTVSEDCHCVLGKWIYSDGKKNYGHLQEYESARQAHAEFHECAGQVLTAHELGDATQAETLLKTKFRTASNLNQMELIRLFSAAKIKQ